MSAKVVAVVASYRSEGMIEQVVAAALRSASQAGAATSLIRLSERQIEFCNNCRACTQSPGPRRGTCRRNDGMAAVLDELESADGVIFASPVNFYDATALFRRFLERLIPYAWWPWGQMAPTRRPHTRRLRAVLIASAAMPGVLIPFLTGARRTLRSAASMLGARVIGSLWIGMAAGKKQTRARDRVLRRAEMLGRRLAESKG